MATTAEYRLGPFPFPRGWFAIANSAEVDREPLSLHYFGRDLVLYRGASGRAVMLDAYCPHMGTHLGSAPNSHTAQSGSRIEGDAIRCPFHAWRFGADGVCDAIPYHDGQIPPAARVTSWTLEERYGIVFVWYDPEGGEPHFGLPEFPEWDDPANVRWAGLDHLIDLAHPVEIFDNMSDVQHLQHLHGTACTRYENAYDGVTMHQRQTSVPDDAESGIGAVLTTLSGYQGPGIAFGRFVELNAAQIICVTPIDDGTCRLWAAAMVTPPSNCDSAGHQAYRDALNNQFNGGLLRDGEIWSAKRPALDIIQMPGDGPFRQSRAWYSQFYKPRAEAAQRLREVQTSTGVAPFT